MILEEGKRKSGSFEALQDMMQKHQSQQDDSDDDDEQQKDQDAKSAPATTPGPSILIQAPDQNEPTAADSNEPKKQPKIRRSVKFSAEEDDGSNFIKN